MTKEGNPLDRIEEALASQKVDPAMKHDFSSLRTQTPDLDPDETQVAFTAAVISSNVVLEGALGPGIGNILAMQMPYSAIPGLVENPEVINLQASREKALPA